MTKPPRCVGPEISAVVPVVSPHVRYLAALLCSLARAHCKFSEVVIVASGSPAVHAQVQFISRLFPRHNIRVVRAPFGPSGKNRNLGLKYTRSDVVAFLDADDGFALNRNCVLREVFAETQVAVFAHSYKRVSTLKSSTRRRFYDSGFESDSCLAGEDFLFKPFSWEDFDNYGAGLRGKNFNLTFKNSSAEFPIAHGHVTVRKSLTFPVSFHEFPGILNEDGLFIQQILRLTLPIRVSRSRLSFYRTKPRPPLTVVYQAAKNALRSLMFWSHRGRAESRSDKC